MEATGSDEVLRPYRLGSVLLKVELQYELDLPWIATRSNACDGSLTIGSATLERVWHPKIHIIRQIEELASKLKISGFRTQVAILSQRQIPIAEAWAPENTKPTISKNIKWRRYEARCVVISRDGPA